MCPHMRHEQDRFGKSPPILVKNVDHTSQQHAPVASGAPAEVNISQSQRESFNASELPVILHFLYVDGLDSKLDMRFVFLM